MCFSKLWRYVGLRLVSREVGTPVVPVEWHQYRGQYVSFLIREANQLQLTLKHRMDIATRREQHAAKKCVFLPSHAKDFEYFCTR
jgi:hypothetical protein